MKRMLRLELDLAAAIVLVLCALATGSLSSSGFTPFATQTGQKSMDEALVAQLRSSTSTPYTVAKVVDGDTFVVKVGSGEATIRVLGINTPETVDPRKPVQCYGPEASARAHALLDRATVMLALDPVNESLDKYGRVLAYVTLPDGTSYNEKMISEGFAQEYTYKKPYEYRVQYKQAQTAARTAALGMWSASTCAGRLQPLVKP